MPSPLCLALAIHTPASHSLTRSQNITKQFSLSPAPPIHMLCSAPTGKSGSKWLDRLRSSKGIPTGDGLDLDSFLLSTAHHSSPHTRPPNPTRIRHPDTHRDPPTMSAVLAELFNMGATLTQNQPSKKKCPRKQTHPKFFLASSSASSSSSAATNKAVKTAVITAANSLRADVAEVEEEEEEPLEREDEEEGNDLKGFTRSEVTMIDTSFPGWKVDKLVFRKNTVWKVRERKHKSKFFAKKKKIKSTHVNGIGTFK